jgi:L-ascorbate metabolism protein UlaG (beta-lactamase superfamily)
MKIRCLGHSSFLITAADGTKVITDPYESGGYGGGLQYGPVRESADFVTVSHEHSDHNYTKDIPGKPVILKKTGKQEVKGITFEGVLTCHDKTGGRERGLNTVFCITVDGVRVCHLGDLGHELSPKEVAAIGTPDVLLVPVGGFFTIDAQEAARVVMALKPKLVIPMHYKTDKCGFPIAPVDDFLKASGLPAQKLDQSEVEVTRSALPQPTEVRVLKHAL